MTALTLSSIPVTATLILSTTQALCLLTSATSVTVSASEKLFFSWYGWEHLVAIFILA